MIKVGITGGIGGGKSTLCRHFKESGVAHYDSDGRAKELMRSDAELKAQIKALFGEGAYTSDGELNRQYLASEVFSSDERREALNSIVHPAVMRDFAAWAEEHSSEPYVVMESAILFEAGLADQLDRTVAVMAPEEMRIMRVVNRDGVSEEQARARIDSQLSDEELHSRADYAVVNIFEEDMEGAAQRLDQIFKQMAFKQENR